MAREGGEGIVGATLNTGELNSAPAQRTNLSRFSRMEKGARAVENIKRDFLSYAWEPDPSSLLLIIILINSIQVLLNYSRSEMPLSVYPLSLNYSKEEDY